MLFDWSSRYARNATQTFLKMNPISLATIAVAVAILVIGFLLAKGFVVSSAVVAVITFLVPIIRFYIEYTKQNLLKRFEKYSELSANWSADKNIQAIIKLLDEDPKHKLRTLPFEKKEAFVGFYEEIAVMFYSGLLKKRIAFYMFGYYTIRCYESKDFWHNLEKDKYYWSLFKRFANEMKQIDEDIVAGRDNPDNWEYEF